MGAPLSKLPPEHARPAPPDPAEQRCRAPEYAQQTYLPYPSSRSLTRLWVLFVRCSGGRKGATASADGGLMSPMPSGGNSMTSSAGGTSDDETSASIAMLQRQVRPVSRPNLTQSFSAQARCARDTSAGPAAALAPRPTCSHFHVFLKLSELRVDVKCAASPFSGGLFG